MEPRLALVLEKGEKNPSVCPMDPESHEWLRTNPVMKTAIRAVFAARRDKGKVFDDAMTVAFARDMQEVLRKVSGLVVEVVPVRKVLRETGSCRDPLTGSSTSFHDTKYERIE
jgi:uncharacterized protein with von Willebrand factor type A (vWA) domain